GIASSRRRSESALSCRNTWKAGGEQDPRRKLLLRRVGKGVIMANIRVAAIQMRGKVGAVADNLSHAESLVREAFRRGAEWVILPEFFTSPAAFTPSMLSAWLPLEGPARELLRKLAREHDGVVGGSFLAKSGQDCFNSFLLVFPNGQY